MGLPYVSFLFALPLRWALGPLLPRRPQPWWAPPQRLNRRAAEVLSTVCALAVVIGFAGSLLALTMTYVAAEFGASRADQGLALGVVRANVVLALGILVLADRRGRRRLILGCAAGAGGAHRHGGLGPFPRVADRDPGPGRGPDRGAADPGRSPCSRGDARRVAGLGDRGADHGHRLRRWAGHGQPARWPGLGTRGWRWLYAAALLFLPLVASTRRHLPESLRWQQSQGRESSRSPVPAGRLALLCLGGFLFSLFATPSSQFQNEFLRTERAFSATRISVFSLVCGTLGGVGVLIGGRLADLRGRRLVAAVGVGGGIVTTVALYVARGWPLWAWGVADSVLGYAVAPALGVYGPELFPTWLRSRATGVVGIAYAAGGVVGLVTVGVLSDHFGTFGPAFALLALGPAALVVLIVVAYPETARRPLEELNPDDRGP